jgi:hypothetical protein
MENWAFSTSFLLGLLSKPGDGGDAFLWNVRLSLQTAERNNPDDSTMRTSNPKIMRFI